MEGAGGVNDDALGWGWLERLFDFLLFRDHDPSQEWGYRLFPAALQNIAEDINAVFANIRERTYDNSQRSLVDHIHIDENEWELRTQTHSSAFNR